eukprot:scaffold61909_cov14-Tisochrysis_lutea.AAC.1
MRFWMSSYRNSPDAKRTWALMTKPTRAGAWPYANSVGKERKGQQIHNPESVGAAGHPIEVTAGIARGSSWLLALLCSQCFPPLAPPLSSSVYLHIKNMQGGLITPFAVASKLLFRNCCPIRLFGQRHVFKKWTWNQSRCRFICIHASRNLANSFDRPK